MDKLDKPNHRPAKPIYAPLPPSLHAAAAHLRTAAVEEPRHHTRSPDPTFYLMDLVVAAQSPRRSPRASSSRAVDLEESRGAPPESSRLLLAPPEHHRGEPPPRVSASPCPRVAAAMPSRRRRHAPNSLSLHQPSGAHDGFLVGLLATRGGETRGCGGEELTEAPVVLLVGALL